MRFHGRAFVIGLILTQSLLGLEIDSDFADARAPKYSIEKASQSITLDLTPLQGSGLSPWYFRVQNIDDKRPLTVRVITEGESVQSIFYTGSSNSDWHEINAVVEKSGSTIFKLKVPEKAKSLFLADQPSLGTAAWAFWIDSLKQKRSYIDTVTSAPMNNGAWAPVLRISEGDKVDARRLAVIFDTDPHIKNSSLSWCMLGLAKWLLGDDLDATWLRQNCEIIVLPTLPSAINETLGAIKADQRSFLHVRFTDSVTNEQNPTASFFIENRRDADSPLMIELPTRRQENFISFHQKFGEKAIRQLSKHLQTTTTKEKSGGMIHPVPDFK